MTNPKAIADQLAMLHKVAYRWARQCCYYQDDFAKDALHTAYLRILEGKAKYKEKGNFKSWLFGVIRFCALEQTRKRHEYSSLEVVDDQLGYVSHQEDLLDGAFYEGIIQKLAPRQAEVLTLVFYHNLTIEDAAQVMEIGIGSARTHYARGKQNLKKLLKPNAIEEGK